MALALSSLVTAEGARAQLAHYTLGDGGNPWSEGGGRGDPVHLVKSGVRAVLDTGNAPGADIEFEHRPGWISPGTTTARPTSPAWFWNAAASSGRPTPSGGPRPWSGGSCRGW